MSSSVIQNKLPAFDVCGLQEDLVKRGRIRRPSQDMPGEFPALLLFPLTSPVAALFLVLEGDAWTQGLLSKHHAPCWEKEILCLRVWDSKPVQDNP